MTTAAAYIKPDVHRPIQFRPTLLIGLNKEENHRTAMEAIRKVHIGAVAYHEHEMNIEKTINAIRKGQLDERGNVV